MGIDVRDGVLSRTSLRDQAYLVLRRWIITEALPHGSKIVERELAAQMEVSRAPVNDALIRLSAEGFVDKRPDGWYVTSFDEPQIERIFAVRIRLEPLAAELAAKSATAGISAALEAAGSSYERACISGIRADSVEADVAIHSLVWELAQNEYLRSALGVVAVPTFMLIPNCIRLPDDWSRTLREHRAIISAITDGDPERAGQAMENHVRQGLARSLSARRSSMVS